MSENNELYHYGIPGMKWGKRKAEKLQAKYNKQTKKLSEIKKTKGVGSHAFRSLAKDRYVTKTKLDYQNSKNDKDETGKFFSRKEIKFAKYVKKNGTDGYFRNVTRPIYGQNLSVKELRTIEMKEEIASRRREIGKKSAKIALSAIGGYAMYKIPKMASEGIRVGNTVYKFV